MNGRTEGGRWEEEGRRAGKGAGRECIHVRTGGVVLFLSQTNIEIKI